MARCWSLPDWRDGQAYEPLRAADRSIHCWEWLRRDPVYRQQSAAALARDDGVCAQWGLHRFEPADLAAPNARPIWHASRLGGVLQVIATASPDDRNAFVLARSPAHVTLLTDDWGDHLSLSDGLRLIRLDCRGAPLDDGPVTLWFPIGGVARPTKPLVVIDRFRRFVRFQRIEPERGAAQQMARMILALRAWDGLQECATHRDIAAELLDADAAEVGWRTDCPSLRMRVRRLVQSARVMAAGKFWSLLR